MKFEPTEKSDKLVIELAKVLISAMQQRVPKWQRAYIRFEASDSHHGAKGSYITDEGIFIFDVFKFNELFRLMKSLGFELREELANEDRRFCLFLLSVDSGFDYNIDFEWNDPSRWAISKIRGATGIPAGLPGA